MIDEELVSDFLALGFGKVQALDVIEGEVVKAFRRLAMKIHPDKVQGEESKRKPLQNFKF